MKIKDEKLKKLLSIYQNPKYRGKYVIMMGRKVYSASSGKEENKLLEELIKKFPREKPLITYIPREETLIL